MVVDFAPTQEVRKLQQRIHLGGDAVRNLQEVDGDEGEILNRRLQRDYVDMGQSDYQRNDRKEKRPIFQDDVIEVPENRPRRDI